MNGMEIAVPGHFGEFLQGRIGPVGPVALVTLPCPALRARALRLPGPFALHRPGARVLSRAGAAGLLLSLGVRPEGRFSLRLDMPAGGGAGASTAARVALARAAGVTDREAIAPACLCSEGAVDPLMLDDPGGFSGPRAQATCSPDCHLRCEWRSSVASSGRCGGPIRGARPSRTSPTSPRTGPPLAVTSPGRPRLGSSSPIPGRPAG